ncbi:hypothetical protein [Paenibacillus sp. UNC451MF]|uniref:hypothetical protein n=1 Tax=Paenibacillus sp. UNC451MF TaxID=1449063 RepID=UPI000490507E|nr:hypothetical protein [Paenibacillus sp. UNC451MF]
MEEMKKSVDIATILNQLDIPKEKYQQWLALQTAVNEPIKSQYMDIDKPLYSYLYREMGMMEYSK